jgi:hypothetical protein
MEMFRLGPARDEVHYVVALLESMSRLEIVQKVVRTGHKLSQPTIARLLNGAAKKSDVAGIPRFAIPNLWHTPNGLLVRTQEQIWRLRSLHTQIGECEDPEFKESLEAQFQLTLVESEKVAEEADEQHLRERVPTSLEHKRDRVGERAGISELRGHVALYREQYGVAFDAMFDAFQLSVDYAMASGPNAQILVARDAANAFVAGADLDKERFKAKEPFASDWALQRIQKLLVQKNVFPLLRKGIGRTQDERIPANLTQAFALMNLPERAEEMLRLGMQCSRDGTDLDEWQPRGFDKPVIKEYYMTETTALYISKEGTGK